MISNPTDQIADLITRIRNAIAVGKTEIRLPSSKLKVAVVEELKNTGYITNYNIEETAPRNTLHIVINSEGENAKIDSIERVSKPGRRVYSSAEKIPVIKSGRGLVLISTSKGIMTGQAAKEAHLGGEILVKIY